MLRVNQLSGFGSGMQIPTLRQADFLLLPSSSRVAIDGTGGFPDIGGNVGTVVNAGTRGGSANATTNSNRGTLQSVGRLAVRGSSSIQVRQTFTAFTGPTIYTISAFIPNAAIGFERVASIALNGSNPDFDNTSGAALLLRDSTSQSWGVYRNTGFRGTISATNGVLTVFETIVSPTEARVCKDGGTDLVTTYSSMGNFNASSFRFLCSHEVSGTYAGSDADSLVTAVFLTNPTAEFRARALAEVRAIAGITMPYMVNYLLVGGGGGGGGTLGGGGGGGQVQSGITNIQIGASITVVRGTGGAGGTPVPDIFNDANYGSSGSATTATGLPSALGGAGGGRHDRSGLSADGTTTANGGGTGSWAGNWGGAGAAGGFAGGNGNSPDSPAGGGGGAGGVGGNSADSPLRSGAGGIGIDSAISGTLTNYGAGGGGNGNADPNYFWLAGAAGGSSGGAGFAGAGVNAASNRGGGGGGGGGDSAGTGVYNGGNGANGVAIFAYPTGSITATGGTITTSGGNTIHTFTSNGTFTRTA